MMRHIRPLWNISAAATLLGVVAVALAATYGPDPVEDLRQALRVPIRDSSNREETQFRKVTLEKRVKALRLSDLRRALLLQEWRDLDREEAIAAVDRPIRDGLVKRLVDRLREILKSGNTPAKLAAISEIGEIGVQVRGSGTQGLARELAPDLIQLLKDGTPVLRESAARVLGKINPEPKPAAAILGEQISNGTSAERIAAADGLAWMLRTLVTLTKGGKTTSTVEVSHEDVVATAAAVVPQAGRGLTDPDVPVRRFCLEALRLASALLIEQVSEPPAGQFFPAPGRKPTPEEQAEINAYRRQVEDEQKLVDPLVNTLNGQVIPLGRTLKDPVAEIRYLAAKALEEIGYARQRIERKVSSVPAATPPEGKKEESRQQRHPRDRSAALQYVAATELLAQKEAEKKDNTDSLTPGLMKVLPELVARFSDPNVRVRLSAAEAIEPFGPLAAPLVPQIARGLSDPDKFMRWATARLLMRIGPADTARTVPLLVNLLCDGDLDVRLAALATLGSYHTASLAAAPALEKAIVTGDNDQRIAAIHAVQSIGREATSAIPTLTAALTNADPRVRRAAAEALGMFGPAAAGATDALTRTLRDFDDTVRKAASDALLAITASQK